MKHAMTIDVEDYFMSPPHIGPDDWHRFPDRLDQSIGLLLEWLAAAGHSATFFVLGAVADRAPKLIRDISEAGHEVGIHGWDHQMISALGEEEFSRHLTRAREAVESATGEQVAGFRLALLNDDLKQQVWALIEAAHRDEYLVHKRVYRPWGYYEGLDAGEQFQVKRIMVEPGKKLSLQMHHHRAEHWVVVSGKANVTRGDETLVLSANESTYIPVGMRHRLENIGTMPLHLIEVQSGSYLGEDDIVRFEDDYKRK